MTKKNVKLLIWILLTLFIGFTSCEKENIEKNQNLKKTDWAKYNLKGKVKSFTNFSYEAIERFGKIEKGEKIDYDLGNFQIKYNDKGNIIEENRYNLDGSLDEKSTYQYKYDTKGNKIEKNEYNSDGSLSYKKVYKYDSKGNLIEGNDYYSNGKLDKNYKYDTKGNIIEENNYIYDGSLVKKYTYKYDNKGNRIESNEYDSDGILNIKYIYI